MSDLGVLAVAGADVLNSTATAVSDDGSTVVGSGSYFIAGEDEDEEDITKSEAFVWTENDDMKGLGGLGGGDLSSEATAVSDDGAVVVGRGGPPAEPSACCGPTE